MVDALMSIDALQTEIPVQEVMNSPVITLEKGTSVTKTAKLMKEYSIGSVVIVDSESSPIGIVTHTDLVNRVLAEDQNPKTLKVEAVMSFPLITAQPKESVQDVATRMATTNVDRVIVVREGKLVGVLSTRDLLRVTPQIMDILSEKARIKQGGVAPRIRASIMGYCDSCGQWSDALVEMNGNFTCPDCVVDYNQP